MTTKDNDTSVVDEPMTDDPVLAAPRVYGGKSLFTALAKAQGEMSHASKDGVNPHFRSKYATLSSVIDAYRVVFAKHGLSVVQISRPHTRGVIVETMLHHASGEYLSGGEVFVPASKNDAQGFGSALTYARRYGLSMVTGVSADDDDGNAAVQADRSAGAARASVQQARQR